MKPSLRLLSLVLISMSIFHSCKKEETSKSGGTGTINPGNKNEILLTEDVKPVDIYDDGNEIVLLYENKSGAPGLIKFRSNGEVAWKKEYPTIAGTPMNLEVTDNGYVFTVVKTELIVHQGPSIIGYFHEGFRCGPVNEEISSYALRTDRLGGNILKSTTYLAKVNSGGTLLSTSTFSYGQSGKMTQHFDDKLLVVTAPYSFVKNSYTIDYRFGPTYPAITYMYHQGFLDFREINLTSGTMQNHTTVTTELAAGLNIANDEEYYEVITNNNFTLIAHASGFVKQNTSGAFTAFQGPYAICENMVRTHYVKNVAYASDNSFYVFGNYTKDSTTGGFSYLAELDLNGNAIWIEDNISGYPDRIDLITTADEDGFFLIREGHEIERHNRTGGVIWTEDVRNTPLSDKFIVTATASPNGITYALEFEKDSYKIVRKAG